MSLTMQYPGLFNIARHKQIIVAEGFCLIRSNIMEPVIYILDGTSTQMDNSFGQQAIYLYSHNFNHSHVDSMYILLMDYYKLRGRMSWLEDLEDVEMNTLCTSISI
ncbi:hypothetical protein ACJX0J_007257, partial [Zea mays]